MNLLAIDCALATSGWSVIKRGKLVECGHWTTDPKASLPERLDDILCHVEELVRRHDIDHLAYEDIQMQNGNVLTFKRLAAVGTMIQFWCEFARMPYVSMPPSHWRKVITDQYGVRFGTKRADQKRAAVEFATGLTGKELTEDEADSYCIGRAVIDGGEFEMKYQENGFSE